MYQLARGKESGGAQMFLKQKGPGPNAVFLPYFDNLMPNHFPLVILVHSKPDLLIF